MHTAKLISVTPDAENLIAYCARVSNPSNQTNETTAPKLLRYLIKHKHWSPFEMAHMVLEISTTRSIAAQILRHRSFSFQEFSQRYAAIDALPKIEAPALRRQDTKNRQNSIDDISEATALYYQSRVEDLFQHAQVLYESMLHAGIAKECARDILPLATPTRIYMSGSIRSWIHYIDLRSANGTQLEHQQIALDARKILTENLPDVAAAVWGDEEGEKN